MRMLLDSAYAKCTALAESHYENFPVGRLVPAALRRHVHAVYAFARHADDLADEGYDGSGTHARLTPPERLQALDAWAAQLTAEHPQDEIFYAVQHTIQEVGLPVSLFTDLISAFKQDVVKRRYADFAEVHDYCLRSANPIGRLVLLLHGFRDPHLLQLSDEICTGLQLANFWQDVAVDLKKDRIYLPQDDQAFWGVTEADLFAHRCTDGYRRLLAQQVARTRDFFARGESLPSALPGGLRWEIRLTWLGGSAILDKIEDLDHDTLGTRPRLTKRDFPLILQAWLLS